MAHELRPKSGEVLPPSEVVRRLREAFPYVRVDAEEGLRRARATAAWIEARPAAVFSGNHAKALKFAEKLKSLPLGESLAIEFGDEPSRTLRFVIMPGEVVQFGYRSADDERALRPLVERCANALDCEIEVI